MVDQLSRPPVAYGKAAIVGVDGDLEHAGAVLHPKLGKPMRAAVGGGENIIPATTKVAPAGAVIDVPLAHKGEIWSFDYLDTLASIAQFERERIAERTKEGLQAAKARGRVGGRPPALSTAQKAEVRRMRDDEQRAISEIARLFKVSERTVRRA